METDPSRGWEAVARRFIELRSGLGADIVRQWARQLPPGGAVLDVGCGSGTPVSAVLLEEGFKVSGIDASPTLAAEFRRQFPSAEIACEAAETSPFFRRRFDGVVAIGLLFLLPAHHQRGVIGRIARALQPGGRFLFSAPRLPCAWDDILTGQPSLSLGEGAYRSALEQAGMSLHGHYVDGGQNDYFDALLTS